MKAANMYFHKLILAGLLFYSSYSLICLAENDNISTLKNKFQNRIYKTYEGTYYFYDIKTITLNNYEKIYLVTYNMRDSALDNGNLLEFWKFDKLNNPYCIQNAIYNCKGVTPKFKDLYLCETNNVVDIYVIQKHPGNGGHLAVDKYTYNFTNMIFIGRTEFNFSGKNNSKWRCCYKNFLTNATLIQKSTK